MVLGERSLGVNFRYDVIPDDFWTNDQPTTPYNTIHITLLRAQTFDSISIAITDDTAFGGVLACSYAWQIKDWNNVYSGEPESLDGLYRKFPQHNQLG
jgi:hypothetical protein